MRIICLAFRNEGDKIVRSIAPFLMSCVKRMFEEKPDELSDQTQVLAGGSPYQVSVYMESYGRQGGEFLQTGEKESFRGHCDWDPREMTLYGFFMKSWLVPQNLGVAYETMLDIARHEVQHALQDLSLKEGTPISGGLFTEDEGEESKDGVRSYLRNELTYLNSPAEVDAYVMAMFSTAKRRHEPLADIVVEDLCHRLLAKSLSNPRFKSRSKNLSLEVVRSAAKKAVRDAMAAYASYIRKRFPDRPDLLVLGPRMRATEGGRIWNSVAGASTR